MELLERDGALAALGEARDAAARGEGRVVFVTGEPGIGKTSLVTRFVRDLEGGARVLFGTCDDLAIPRPLGPIRDLVGTVSAPLEEALSRGAAAHDIQSRLIAELELPPQPTVLVLEDVHWADDATLDSVTVLGRRIASLPALVVLTFRGGEAPPPHPLRAAVGAIRAEDSLFLELAPLSERAVASLAGDDADDVYAATGGNPFYVSELLTYRGASELPPSIANAVLGRASRLDDAARHLVELVSVVPRRVETSVLDAVLPDWAVAAEEPERRQLLEVDPRYVRFRHELARNAIRSSVPIAARRRLHAEILEALPAADADPADIVHHAEAAGAEHVVADYALVAARRAAALESHREAYSHYRRASDFIDRLQPTDQATVLEEVATTAYVVGRLEHAFPAITRAIAIYGDLGDEASEGRCTRFLSRLHWFAGEAPLRGRRHSRRSRSSSRSASRSSSPARTAACRSSPCSRRTSSRRSPGAIARSSSRPGSATRAHAHTRSSTSVAPGSCYRHDLELTGFIDGTENFTLIDAPGLVLIPDGRPGAGGTILLLQKSTHDTAEWEALPVAGQEQVIGRTKRDSVELEDRAPDSHVASTDQERFGKIFRRNMPYGTVTDHGTVLVGFTVEQRPLSTMLDSMAGLAGGTRDALALHAAAHGCPLLVPSTDSLRRVSGAAALE